MSKNSPNSKSLPASPFPPPIFQMVIRGACRYGRIQAAARKSARCWVSGSPVRSFSVHVPHIEAVVHDLAPPILHQYVATSWKDGRMSAPTGTVSTSSTTRLAVQCESRTPDRRNNARDALCPVGRAGCSDAIWKSRCAIADDAIPNNSFQHRPCV